MKRKPESPRNLIGAITIATLLSCIASHGAPIIWGSATDVATTADVATTGAFVEAFNLSSRAADTSTVTVNGITFTGLTSPSPLTNAGAAASAHLNGNTSGDVGYNSLLNTAAFGGGASTSITVGGGNLINGRDYLIQVWYVEERTTGAPALNTRQMIYGSPGGSTVTVGGTAGLLGQYVIGTFTADGPNQTLTLATPGAPFLQSHLTAYQIRATGTPPTSPSFATPSISFQVNDGAAFDTLVGTASASDPDGSPAPLAYSIASGNDSAAFAIDPANGEITVVGSINFDSQSYYSLTVEATDSADTASATVDIHVIPTPPVIAIGGSSLGVNNWFSAGFGNAGYLFASTDNDDPAAGLYKRGGVIYTAAETPSGGQNVLFTRLSSDLKPWSNNGTNQGNPLTAALNVNLENPAGGTFKAGSFWNAGLNGDLPVQSFRLTFGQAVPQGYRLGILVGAAESQGEASTFTATTGNLRDIPYQLSVNGVTVATTQTALGGTPDWLTTEPADPNTGAPSADWYFFDLTDVKPGSSVTISATRIYSANSHKFNPINGLALAALATGPAITGVSLSGTTLTLDFTGEPGVTNWKIMAGTDLQSFPIDETPGSISEGPPGVYQALIDVTGDPPRYFLRVEHTR
jgi:Cadherin domain